MRQWAVLGIVAVVATVWLPASQAMWLNVMNPWWTQTMVGGCVAVWRDGGEAGWPAYSPVSGTTLPDNLRRAAVISEDQAFYMHDGFDWEAISAAWARYRSPGQSGSLRGGSTISQQVARNVFLWQGRNWVRKGLEAWYTVWLETFVPKERILEVYLNVAELGPCTFGAEEAAQRWFGKSASKLTEDESARLVALLPAPRQRTPRSAVVSRRAAWIVAQRYEVPRAR